MARGYNKVILMGNLAKDPELRKTQSGQSVASMSVAVNREWKDKGGEKQSACDFISVVAWGPTADNCDKYLSKGRPVLVEGRLQVRSYDDKAGQKRWITEVVASDVTFLPSGNGKKDGDSGGSAPRGGHDDGFPMDISEMDRSGGDDETDIPF